MQTKTVNQKKGKQSSFERCLFLLTDCRSTTVKELHFFVMTVV